MLRLTLAVALIVAAPGSRALAAALSRPAAKAWAPVVAGLNARRQAGDAPGLTPAVGRTLGHVVLELAANPKAAGAALGFVSHLPPEAAEPAAFAALPVAQQARLAQQAVVAEKARLAASGSEELDGAWFYLDPREAEAARQTEAVSRRLKSGSSRARDAALRALFDGAEAVAGPELDGPPAAAAGLVEAKLARYGRRALAEADLLLGERGDDKAAISLSLIENPVAAFGRTPSSRLLGGLRRGGQWNDFVAALSIAAGRSVGRLGELDVLREAGANPELRLRIPSWHPLSRRHETVADWLASRHGAPAPAVRRPLHLFTAWGIPVRITAGGGLLAALIGYSVGGLSTQDAAGTVLLGAAGAALMLGSVLAHEFAHILAGRALGVRARTVELNFFGGAADMDVPRSPRKELLISIAGPLMNVPLALAGLAAYALLPGPLATLGGVVLAGNAFMALFNLLPAFPMDGGRALRAGLAALLSDHYRATKVAGWVGTALFAAMTAAAVWFGQPRMAVFGVFFMLISRMAAVHPGTDVVEQR